MKIIKGDATNPLGSGPKILCHICNDKGKWGKGFVVAVSDKWPKVKEEFRQWFKEGVTLGNVQFVSVMANLTVANMIAQHGLAGGSNPVPLRYWALEECLTKVYQEAIRTKATVHMPRIGAGLAGGNWTKINGIIRYVFSNFCSDDVATHVPVTVYDR